ncbi:hypothetical protein LTR36_000263 [Oleoguttula mirabilis]|uniref:Uncharacterized protein n=1 Tax=Oleoguttula mirabilis TaxID=1507867 RepID=A0AAV9JYF7_9PEZI|nr:hypothetical protein LTR36_000263 [Oleoguttula mirabilis]
MSAAAPPPTRRWATFDDLSGELRNRIYKLLVARDKVVITSKAVRGMLLTSRFSLAFSSSTGAISTRAEYQDLLEERIIMRPGIIRVNVVDYNFGNFDKYLKYLSKLEREEEDERLWPVDGVLKPYLFQYEDDATSIMSRNLDGPYFAANLIFTKRFDNDQQKLQRWLRQGRALEKQHGHLRVFYKVTRYEASKALSDMLSHLDFQQGGHDFEEDKSGQWLFIYRALQKEFAPRLEGGWMYGEINDGFHSDFPVVDGEEEAALRKMFGVEMVSMTMQ